MMVSTFFAAALAAALALSDALSGTFALQSGAAKSAGHLAVTAIAGSKLDDRFDLWLTDSHGATIRRYDVDMTKYVHLIIISDDFTYFAHVHPALGRDGHFRIEQRFPHPGSYLAYADCEPQALGQQVFRFDVSAGGAKARSRDVAPTGTSVAVDGYRVALDTVALRANAESKIAVRITKGGEPARDLHPYLGALAHAVFIDAGDLSYLHVHPAALGAPAMEMGGDMAGMHMDDAPLPDREASASEMQLDARVSRAGTYKLWLQFRGGGGLHVAAFVLHAS